jgi:hypothetical protein
MSKETTRNSSTTAKPLCRSPRRLVDWLNPDGQKRVHSLVDKVYQPKLGLISLVSLIPSLRHRPNVGPS